MIVRKENTHSFFSFFPTFKKKNHRDVKGRLAALRRSKQRISKEKVKWSSDLAANTLMLDLERTLANEQIKLEKNLKEIVETKNIKEGHPETLLSMALQLRK